MALVVTPYCLTCDICGEEIAVPRNAARNGEALMLFAEATAIRHNLKHAKTKLIQIKPKTICWADLVKPFRDELERIA
ncbi:hypothetical protein [Granulicella tundricola]|uniref:Uncharacterized protein n=1 Tax=Granulicella tundricola (strain ATCC BAA-1859 / DSM 23138 / MP5ACTX9) TaxID=1198114 RepID=E8X0Q0_GRATM|nr:hypothetical protein [Granulicella tundricola]ADW69001.1 hypothetical protein AciX9_1955 [Granulicella tundricola MP5ACTX9]